MTHTTESMANAENPPAFPRPGFEDPAGMQDGMSLRDWFAGQALAGAMACPTMRSGLTSVSYATMSYEIADAMLAARSKGEEA